MVSRSTVRDGSINEITPCLILYTDTRPPSRYDNNPRQLHHPLHQPSLPGPASSAMAQNGIGISVWPKSLTLPT